MSWDGRRHKVPVVCYELVVGERGAYDQLVWRMTLTCGHVVEIASGREAQPGQFGAVEINGSLYLGVAKKLACRDLSCPTRGDASP